jgi:hypothetical protein
VPPLLEANPGFLLQSQSTGVPPQPCSHGVGGVVVEAVAGAVVGPGGTGIGVAHGVLNVLQRYASAQEARGEAVAQAMRAELISGGDAGAPGQAPDEPPGT